MVEQRHSEEVGPMKIGIERGQRWYWLYSWLNAAPVRRFKGGFAIGPVVFLKKGVESWRRW